EGSLEEKLIRGFQCAEILEKRLTVDPVRLRMVRLLLYRHYSQLCCDVGRNPELLSRRSRGRDTASIAIDALLEQIY
ncbi:hypothetical protein K469DRAFT_496705, partial [Zopfia rhizophila CBS 207.26]